MNHGKTERKAVMYVNVIRREPGRRTLYAVSSIDWSPHNPEALLYTAAGPISIDREQVTGLFVMGEGGNTIEKIPPLRRDPKAGIGALDEKEVVEHDLAEALGEKQ